LTIKDFTYYHTEPVEMCLVIEKSLRQAQPDIFILSH
jgi:hypothetical protein